MFTINKFSNSKSWRSSLNKPQDWLITCFCASWCETCRRYQNKFYSLSHAIPKYEFIWIDIEEHPEILEDEEIENFPTVLIQNLNNTLFYGPVQPHISHLRRLLKSVERNNLITPAKLPRMHEFLKRC